MPASERDVQPRPQGLTAQPSSCSMRELLASCAAASAVSTPPAAPVPQEAPVDEPRRDAA
ncbi:MULTISPECIES: hypothetical protein [unclassified Streptomyces]|uniref:hypothetical protein n=1 Tax=unclassified Streptomyces TaxID=2593676 RepID=UPI001110045F|nr:MULTISPECIES: hypothetical protein [unclassified Streptomyces]MCI3932499.1 hypothetical protein [Streptomyces sp. AN091965]